jgi:hypothetical protein
VNIEQELYISRFHNIIGVTFIVESVKTLHEHLPLQRPEFDPRSGNVGFVVDTVAVGEFLFVYFGFPLQILTPLINQIYANTKRHQYISCHHNTTVAIKVKFEYISPYLGQVRIIKIRSFVSNIPGLQIGAE